MPWTLADLEALDEALMSGAQSVQYESKSVSYRSIDDMLRVRTIMRIELGLTSNQRTALVAHQRGYGPTGGVDG
jgi:hypothetical protein